MLGKNRNWFGRLAGAAPLMLLATALGYAAQPVPGAELLMPLKTQLQAALKDGLQDGPVHAVRVCKEQAPAIADALSVDGIRMGRASHRLRNPENVPPAWVNEVLESYLAENASLAPETRELDDGRKGYVEPIVVQPLCLACHGEQLSDEVETVLLRTYPNDNATGFKVGDLRGVYWVEYPLSLESQNGEQ